MTTDGTNAANSGTDPSERPFSLVIGVTSSPAERLRLTELLDGVAPLLMVADLDELRELITEGPAPADAPAPPVPPAKPAPDGALVIDAARSSARWGIRETALTRLERDLLTCLTAEPVRVWSYAELHHAVWHDAPTHGRADVQSLVKRLRRKLDELGTGVTIAAVRGVGLRLTDHRHPRVRGD
ncbi:MULTISPECIES: winged helix-turn-helix domain-containing protein [unclassified Micromonospora]|uniref:winged helix-turn-helix domain-containing protein n=1 Tax=unclassified Micromonospora TaxID=2617518 RepID=UPI001C219C75|nr:MULTISPECIES: winged helix-turn-helix domain-containing protein [unclassified Micromonospora]MBU8859838.1 winged helix-turn-helix domain-containing protein [Micromonospora sp. WMMB482]MDM4779359.1 winged helix-turn-helix domain-containing protein [Micromonospora sp. b486]